MKKILKITILFIFCLILFSIGKNAEANSISSISMEIYVDENGNAKITETWKCNTNQGTEVYHPYYNLGNSEIINFCVSENGKNYTSLNSWKTSGTLDSKAYKCGINKISNGVELCWGISEYGNHTYIASYEITNFVSTLTDSQMIYWTLIPYDFSNTIGNVYIKIYTDFYIPKDIEVWGYGNYGGTAYVYDGYIEMQSDGSLRKDEYMTILVKFPLNTFNSQNELKKDFNYYYELAQEGATTYKNESSYITSFLQFFSSIIIYILIILSILIIVMNKNSKVSVKKISKDVPYFRDIPCENDTYRIYYISYIYGLIKNKTDLLGAVILSWLKKSLIRIEQKETGVIFKRDDTRIVLNETKPEAIENSKERLLFKMLLEASRDGILENKEFEKWCKKSYSRILPWFDDIINAEKNKLIEKGLIVKKEKKILKIFKTKQYTATQELQEIAEQIAGLKRYLLDYTYIKERKAIEVHLFEDYLICAQILGIAKEVAKEFKDLYPEVIEQSNFYSYDNIIFINVCATRGIYSANSARARAQSYSSGGGRFSSGGGGGGSFGGGGGGRRFPLNKKCLNGTFFLSKVAKNY